MKMYQSKTELADKMSDLAANGGDVQMTPEDLKDFQRDLLVTVFNETHDQLLLYQQGRHLKTAKTFKSRKIPQQSVAAQKCKTMPSAEILDDIKLDRELDALRNIYKVGYEALSKDKFDAENPYADVMQAIELQKQTTNEVDVLTKELEANKLTLKQLKDLQVKKENENTEKLSQKTQRVKDLQGQLKNIKRINSLELRLVQKWENNRLTQAMIVGENAERSLMREILELNRRTAGEHRLINAVQSFRDNEIAELKAKTAHWEKKFQEDTAEIKANNSALTEDIADVVKSHENHCEIAKQRKLFVAEYLQQKAEEQRLYEEQCYRVECAIRIQSWWRGVMVRRCLGPYRKKSKKSKKAKSKK